MQVTGMPGMQVPVVLQISLPLHALPSLQDEPAAIGVCVTPATGSQASAVHGFWSSVATGEPGWQVPVWQVSPAVQALLSVQVVPFDLEGFEQTPVD